MADSRSVWGIDVGQAGLKAIQLQFSDASKQVTAVAFDYVPHPKILSQPDAIPEELISQALETFLARNDVQGSKIAISVPGQSALSRFIQLPPVESSKIAEIVKYEARQQIPFALEDVIWDYQTLGGGIEESGYMLEAEVGLFAMKREQVLQALRPFTDAKLEIELIQIAPLCLYNFVSYDQLGIRPEDETAARDEYTIVLDMGADDTTLLVSNGERIWIRTVPLGGNHFTRALTKDMKLTFAKAEHLKCNATKSPDPRAVFQALRPVFNEYVSEIQRSIGYFSSVNRDARISKVVGLGNGFKLAGLQKFLQQNLQYEVERVDTFHGVVGDNVLSAALFEDNILSFAVAYGTALQALNLSRIHTSLLPPEIVMSRTIQRKKPWAVVSAAVLLACLSTSALGYAIKDKSVSKARFGDAEEAVDSVKKTARDFTSGYTAAKTRNETIESDVDKLTSASERREYWLEIYKAINECLPRDEGDQNDEVDIAKQNRMRIKSVTAELYADGIAWVAHLPPDALRHMVEHEQYIPPVGGRDAEVYGIRLDCVHYHHDPDEPAEGGLIYVQNTMLENLKQWTIQNEDSPHTDIGRMGISHATITYDDIYPNTISPSTLGRNSILGPGRRKSMRRRKDDDVGFGGGQKQPGLFDKKKIPLDDETGNADGIEVTQTDFIVEFAWSQTPLAARGSDGQPPPPSIEGKEKLVAKGKKKEKKSETERDRKSKRRGRED